MKKGNGNIYMNFAYMMNFGKVATLVESLVFC